MYGLMPKTKLIPQTLGASISFIILIIICLPAIGLSQPAKRLFSQEEVYKKLFKSLGPELEIEADSVLASIIFYNASNRLSEIIGASERFSYYSGHIDKEIRKRDIPEELRFLPLAISGMRISFSDHCNRGGIWGLPPATAVAGGLRITAFWDERFDPSLSTMVALDRISELYEKYNNWWHAIIAFSNGESGLRNAFIRTGDSNAGIPELYHNGNLPAKEVITELLSAIFIHSYLITHGITEKHETQTGKHDDIEKITISSAIKKPHLLEVTNLSRETFRRLNPVYISDILIPHPSIPLCITAEAHSLFLMMEDSLYLWFHSPYNSIAEMRESFQNKNNATSEQKPEYIVYTVKRGDMLGSIARRHGVSVNDIKEWNKLRGDTIYPGQKLKILKNNK